MEEKIVKHVGIILDGNRRHAKKNGIKLMEGYKAGAENVENLFKWTKDLDIKQLTLYAFSMQNFNRAKEEVDYLMNLFQIFFDRLMKQESKFEENGIKVKFIGRIEKFPPKVHAKMLELMEKTKDNKKYLINFAMAYGGREEIVDACKKISEKVLSGDMSVDNIDIDTFNENVYMGDQPDFIIRTGGDFRTSNFLMWQSWYSEWFFLEKTWPEFSKEDLVSCIDQFQGRERRFGK